LHHAIDVAATPEACWQVLADFASWPEWFPHLKHASGPPWVVGGKFEMVLAFGPVSVPVVCGIEELRQNELVRWVGRGWGITGDHAYRIEQKHPGFTRVTSHEELRGMGTMLITSAIKTRIDDAVHQSMASFKRIVEARRAA